MKTRIKVIMRARSKLSVNISNHVVVAHIEKISLHNSFGNLCRSSFEKLVLCPCDGVC